GADERTLRARQNVAVLLTEMGRYDEALAELVALAKASPGDPMLMVNYGILRRLRGELTAARALLEQALDLIYGKRPPSLDATAFGNAFGKSATANLGVVFYELGRFDEARRAF